MSLEFEPSIKTRRRHTSMSWRVQNYNSPLSKLEIDSIHASVQDARADLERIQRDLHRAQMAVKSLSKEYGATTKFIARELALLSPIRGLPREMLAEIFVHHSRMFAKHDRYIRASLVVSQVCKSWRSIAHATALLWVRFPLYYRPDFRASIPDRQMLLYKAWLLRVGTLSCDVAVRKAPPSTSMAKSDYYEDDDEEEKPTYSLRPFYEDHRSISKDRWRMLDLEYVFDSSVTLKSIGPVRSLTLHIDNPQLIKRSELLVEHAPKLEGLVVRCQTDFFNAPVLMPRLPMTTVKHCNMDRFPMVNGLQFLHGATALETFKFTIAYSSDEGQMPTVTTTIHTLDLSVWGLPDDALEPLFAHLTAPNLDTLKILWMYRPDDPECDASSYWDSDKFNSFLTRSAASLTSVTLLHADLNEADLISLFEHTPLLVKFEYSDRYERQDWLEGDLYQALGPRLLARLHPSAASVAAAPVLVPKLEVLSLRGGFEGNDICDADILGIFEARCLEQETGYVTRLSAGALHLLRAADQQPAGELSLAERATRLRERGLKFEFTTLEPDPDAPDSDDEDSE